MADEGRPGTGQYAGQVWDGKRWVPSAPGALLPGSVDARGRVWDGALWIDGASPAAEVFRADAVAGKPPMVPALGTPLHISRQDVLDYAILRTARATEATAYGLVAILVAVAGLVAIGIMGAAPGGLVALGALVVAGVLAVMAFTKVVGKDYLPPAG